MGESDSSKPFARITRRNKERAELLDGAVSPDGMVWGSYIHGLFDSDTFRTSIINSLKEARGLSPAATHVAFVEERNCAFDALADLLKENLDIESILKIIGYSG